jgi:hypothetical protein
MQSDGSCAWSCFLLQHLSPSPSAEERLIVIRCLPSAGTLDTNTPTHHNVCISDSGVRVSDKGYGDDKFLRGFRRGWYVNSDLESKRRFQRQRVSSCCLYVVLQVWGHVLSHGWRLSQPVSVGW